MLLLWGVAEADLALGFGVEVGWVERLKADEKSVGGELIDLGFERVGSGAGAGAGAGAANPEKSSWAKRSLEVDVAACDFGGTDCAKAKLRPFDGLRG